jgi:hypothetical protein
VGLQTIENKVLSRGIIGKSAPILAEITIRKSQGLPLLFGHHQHRSSDLRVPPAHHRPPHP